MEIVSILGKSLPKYREISAEIPYFPSNFGFSESFPVMGCNFPIRLKAVIVKAALSQYQLAAITGDI